MYVVVMFPATNDTEKETIAVVPSLWINYDLNTCKWPPKKYNSDKVTRWVMSLMEPKNDFEDISVKIMYEYDTYAKARKASIKAEEDSAIDTAAGETDLDKPRKRQKPARFEKSDSSDEVDKPHPKKSKRRIYSPINDTSDEEIPTENIRDKVKALLEKRQPSISKYQIQKPRPKKSEIVSVPSYSTSPDTSQSSHIVEQDSLFETYRDPSLLDEPSVNMSPLSPRVFSDISNKTSANKASSAKTAVLQSCSTSYRDPPLLNDPLLSENISPREISSPLKRTSSLRNICTVKDTASSSKSTIPQPVPKSSLPSLMKNIRMQSDPYVATVLKTLMDRQEELNGKVDHVILMLHRIHRNLGPEEKVITPRNLPALPLKNEESLLHFQKFLMSDDNFYPVVDYFVKLMKIDGQIDENTAVGRLLPKVISNSLARMINYAGSGVKLKFENTKLHEAINCAVLNAFPESNLVKTDKKISRWLYTSNQRRVN